MGHQIQNTWRSVYALDFAAQPNLTIVSGANTIDGSAFWDAKNHANASAFEIVNGSGLEVTIGAAGNWVNGSALGPVLTFPFERLGLSDPTEEIRMLVSYTFVKEGNAAEVSGSALGWWEDNSNGVVNAITGYGVITGVESHVSKFTYAGISTYDYSADSIVAQTAVIEMLAQRSYIATYSGATIAAGVWPKQPTWLGRGSGPWISTTASSRTHTPNPGGGAGMSLCLGLFSANTLGQKITITNIEVYKRSAGFMPTAV